MSLCFQAIADKIFPCLVRRYRTVGILGMLNGGPEDFSLIADFVHLHDLTPGDPSLSHWLVCIGEEEGEFDDGDAEGLAMLLRSKACAERINHSNREHKSALHSKFAHQLHRTAKDATRRDVISIVLIGQTNPSGEAFDVGWGDDGMISPLTLERALKHTKAARIFVVSTASLSNNWINPLWTLISVPSYGRRSTQKKTISIPFLRRRQSEVLENHRGHWLAFRSKVAGIYVEDIYNIFRPPASD